MVCQKCSTLHIRGHSSKPYDQILPFWPPPYVWIESLRKRPKCKIFCNLDACGWGRGVSDSDTDCKPQHFSHFWTSCLLPTPACAVLHIGSHHQTPPFQPDVFDGWPLTTSPEAVDSDFRDDTSS